MIDRDNGTESPHTRSAVRGDVHHHEFWSAGELRCVLIARQRGTKYVVEVLDDDRTVATARCSDPDHGAQIAEAFWKEFVEVT